MSSARNYREALPVSVWLILVVSAGITGFLAGHKPELPGPTLADRRTADTIAELRPTSCAQEPISRASSTAAIGPTTISDIAAHAGKSVVHIEISTKPAVQGNKCAYFFGPQSQPVPDAIALHGKYASAAGIIIREDGYILTNAHVVQGADEMRVTLVDGREYMAELAGKDDVTDLALIKISADNLPFARFGDSNRVRPGEWAIAIGSPFHLKHSISLGIVSALERSIGDPYAGMDLLQTDAAINPGNSGGPLLNLGGEVIGINCVVRTDAQNISFAVPSVVARKVADALLQSKKVSHGYIGVKLQDVLPMSLADDEPRVLITGADLHAPAWQAGARNGDLIQAVNGKRVRSSFEVLRVVNDSESGANLKLSVMRRRKLQELQVTVGGQ